MQSLTLSLPGTLGNNTGTGSIGVLIGSIADTAVTKFLLNRAWDSAGQHCVTEKNATLAFVDETTPFGEGTASDVEVFTGTPAVGDAVYFGSENSTFGQLDLVISDQGAGTWTVAWEYWNGTAWTALSGVTDGTTAFTAAAGTVSVTFTIPTNWAKNTIPTSINAYWCRARIDTYSALTTLPQLTRGYVITTLGIWVDETTDANSAGAADIELFTARAKLNDAIYIGGGTTLFTKTKITLSTAASATMTVLPEYWNGTSWATIPVRSDDSAGFSTGTSTYAFHFEPPSDWAQNTALNGPNANTGYFIRFRISAFTSITTAPVGTRAYIEPVSTSALTGFKAPAGMSTVEFTRFVFQAQTVSASNADSIFNLYNKTSGLRRRLTWTAATPTLVIDGSFTVAAGDEIALIQITEDGTTEYANASLTLLAA